MKRTISIFIILFSLFIAINSVYATDSNTGVSSEDEVQNLPQEEIDSKIAETEKEALKSQIKGAYTAPIILIDTGHDSGISQYRGVRYRHYNTIKAVVDRENYSTGTSIVISATRVDPHYDNKYYGVYSNPISQIYQAVTQAERKGSNKVLVY